jgi:hypothetical protein
MSYLNTGFAPSFGKPGRVIAISSPGPPPVKSSPIPPPIIVFISGPPPVGNGSILAGL